MPELNTRPIIIKEGDIATCVNLSQKIPEFLGPPPAEEYYRRMEGIPHLILVAFAGDLPVAFKVGYQKEDYFYSWLGGVIPDFRRRGLAKRLADRQEIWARALGYTSITFKTRNQHKNMLIFALRNGFDIIGFREKESIAANRILLRKAL